MSGHNVLWRTRIPGLGHSSPVIWGDRIFVTTSVSDDPDPVFRYGTDGRMDPGAPTGSGIPGSCTRSIATVATCSGYARRSAPPREIQRHPQNSYASATPATDGKHVAVLVATGNLFLYDFDGTLLWEVDLGALDSGASYDDTYQWAAASSPIIWENLVIVQADQQEGSFIRRLRHRHR